VDFHDLAKAIQACHLLVKAKVLFALRHAVVIRVTYARTGSPLAHPIQALILIGAQVAVIAGLSVEVVPAPDRRVAGIVGARVLILARQS